MKAEEHATIPFFPVTCVSDRMDYKSFQSCGEEILESFLTSWQNRVAQCPRTMVCGQATEVSARENCCDLRDTMAVVRSNTKIEGIGKADSGGEI